MKRKSNKSTLAGSLVLGQNRPNRRPARCSAEYQAENRKLDCGPRFFCDCDRGHPGNHAVLCCTHNLKAKILVQWPNDNPHGHVGTVRTKAGRKMT